MLTNRDEYQPRRVEEPGTKIIKYRFEGNNDEISLWSCSFSICKSSNKTQEAK